MWLGDIYIYICVVRGDLNGISGCVAFLPSQAGFSPHFLKIVVEVKVSEPPHVLRLWLGG